MRTQIHGVADKIEDSAIYRQVLDADYSTDKRMAIYRQVIDADYSSDERMRPQYFWIEANHRCASILDLVIADP